MSNNMRHRWGNLRPIAAPVVASCVIEVGDLMVLFDTANMLDGTTFGNTATYKVYPFSKVQTAAQADEEALCSDHFIGVSMQASADGEDDDIRVATNGAFEFPLDSATTIYLGDVIEVYSAAANAMEDQKVTKGSTDPLGRAVKAEASATNVTFWIATKYRPVYA